MGTDAEKLLAEMCLELKAVRSELLQIRDQISGAPNFVEGWASPRVAAQALKNEGVKSAQHLKNLRLDGAFNSAKNAIRNVGKGDRPTWQYHIPSCRKALQQYFRKMSG